MGLIRRQEPSGGQDLEVNAHPSSSISLPAEVCDYLDGRAQTLESGLWGYYCISLIWGENELGPRASFLTKIQNPEVVKESNKTSQGS